MKALDPIPGWTGLASSHPLYVRWAGMRSRCNYKKNINYHNYGGRGVTVCERWNSFVLFVEDMGMPPSKLHSLDRIDSSGNYEPSNCRWSTTKEQSRNTRRNVYVEIEGKSLTVRDWEIEHKVVKGAYQRRIDLGWPPIEAVTQPIIPGKALFRRSSTNKNQGVTECQH